MQRRSGGSADRLTSWSAGVYAVVKRSPEGQRQTSDCVVHVRRRRGFSSHEETSAGVSARAVSARGGDL